jgi:Mg2+-importing ATPase
MMNPHDTNHYWSQPTGQLLTTLQSSAAGLKATEAQQRLERVGPNVLETRAEVTPLRLFLKQFRDPIVLILLFATAV